MFRVLNIALLFTLFTALNAKNIITDPRTGAKYIANSSAQPTISSPVSGFVSSVMNGVSRTVSRKYITYSRTYCKTIAPPTLL